MNGQQYLFYVSTSVQGEESYYTFRVMLMDDSDKVLYNLLDDKPLPLSLIDVPLMIPATIPEDTTFNKVSGGTWDAPADLYFLYLKDLSSIPAVYPTGPGEESVIISAAIADEPELVYVSHNPGENYPSGESPDDNPPDEDGWFLPETDDWTWAHEIIATRHTSYTPVQWSDGYARYLWCYEGCEFESGHLYYDFGALTYNAGLYQYIGDDLLITCCNEGDEIGYLIDSEWLGSTQYYYVWLYVPTTPIRYYPYEIVGEPGIDIALPGILGSAFFLLTDLLGWQDTFFQRFGGLAARRRWMILGDTTAGILGDTTAGIIGGEEP